MVIYGAWFIEGSHNKLPAELFKHNLNHKFVILMTFPRDILLQKVDDGVWGEKVSETKMTL